MSSLCWIGMVFFGPILPTVLHIYMHMWKYAFTPPGTHNHSYVHVAKLFIYSEEAYPDRGNTPAAAQPTLHLTHMNKLLGVFMDSSHLLNIVSRWRMHYITHPYHVFFRTT